jgi:hypothetical protein
MNVAMLIPTGLGCAIGGHSGDATPVAKLLASVCDTLLVHPNVVNAGDIIDLPSNAWYVPGRMLDYLIENERSITEPKYNRVILVTERQPHPSTINAMNAAERVYGMFIQPVHLHKPLNMLGWVEDGKAQGEFENADGLIGQVSGMDYDAIAVHTPITVDREYAEQYQNIGGINPWGKVEARLSGHLIEKLGVPVAHAPVPDDADLVYSALYPRLAAEGASGSYLMSVLKGLSFCPRLGGGFSRDLLDFLVVPAGLGREFPVKTIRVTENTCAENFRTRDGVIVKNYLEAAAWIAAKRVGVDPIRCLKDAS